MYAASLSTDSDATRALDEVLTKTLDQLGKKPDLALLFFSPHHGQSAQQLSGACRTRLGDCCLLGCMGESIAGNDQEIEQGPALSLWLASWGSQVALKSFHLTVERTSEGPSLMGWPDDVAEANPEQSALLLLGDPYTFATDFFLKQANENHKGLRVMGGMSSGADGPGQTRLLLGDQVLNGGAVGVFLQGQLKIRGIVSQGCRPIGKHLVITKAKDNLIQELGGKPALARLQELWQELPPADQELLQQGLHVGRVINEYQGKFQRGDFLVRNVMGVERESGALAITDYVRVGQTVQFHLRDAATADEDLRDLLHMDLSAHARRPAGALLFTCNGRGTRLFPEPHHDASVIRSEAGPIPLAGFFAQGELGPVGGQNFIHGFTASVVLFEE